MDSKKRQASSIRMIMGIGIVALLAQLGWMALNFSALPMWVDKQLNQGAHLGIIMGAFMLTEAVFRPSLGALSDRIGRKPLMLIGPTISMFTSVATIYVTSPIVDKILGGVGIHLSASALNIIVITTIVLLRAIDGVGLAAFWPASFAAIGDVVEEKHRGKAMAVLNGTGMAGMALGMLFGGLANDLTKSFLPPLTGAFWFVSFVFLLTVVAGVLIFPKETKHHHHIEEEIDHIPHKAEVRSVIHFVPDMIILSLVVFAAIGILMPIVKLYAYDQLGMSETQFGGLVAPLAAVLGLFAVPLGHLADKWGKMVSVCYGMLMCTIAMWLIAIFKYKMVLIGASGILGVGFALAFPSWMAVISLAAPKERRGQVMGVVGLAQGVGAMIGVQIAPIIYSNDWLSLPGLGVVNYNIPFYICAILLSVGSVMTFTWITHRRKQCGGRCISLFEQRAVIAASILGALAICGWVVVRYSNPVAPDRVAWQWVRQLVHDRPEKATQFTLPSFEKNARPGTTSSQMASQAYSGWVNKDKGRYTLNTERISSDRKTAYVELKFKLLDRQEPITEHITLLKQPSGEWKISQRSSK